MERRNFLRLAGVAGVASMMPGAAHAHEEASEEVMAPAPVPAPGGGCVLIPSETDGPFPLDLTANTYYFRQDVREDRTGAAYRLRLRIMGSVNCLPMANARVNIWHCDADGVYSGYPNQQGGLNTTGLTFLRGYQLTDNNGEVEFVSIFPGWYNGRVCHIHFQVFVNSNYHVISQLTYPVTDKQAVYMDNPVLYPNGTDPLTPDQDGVFSDGYQYQLATLTYNSITQEYESFLEVTIQGSGVSTGLHELLNSQQFTVGQNQPNPFMDVTVIPVTLNKPGDLTIDLYDVNGRRVGGVVRQGLSAGEHRIPFDVPGMGLPIANYAYQVELRTADGVFRTCKLMTGAK